MVAYKKMIHMTGVWLLGLVWTCNAVAQSRAFVERRQKILSDLPSSWVVSSALRLEGKDWAVAVRDLENAYRQAPQEKRLEFETALVETRWQLILVENSEAMQTSLKSLSDWRKGGLQGPHMRPVVRRSSWIELETQALGMLKKVSEESYRRRVAEVLSGLYLLTLRHEQAVGLIQRERLETRAARWIVAEARGLGQGWGIAEPELVSLAAGQDAFGFWSQLRLAREFEREDPRAWTENWLSAANKASGVAEGQEKASLLVRELLTNKLAQVHTEAMKTLLNDSSMQDQRSQLLLMAYLQAKSDERRASLYEQGRFSDPSVEDWLLGQIHFDRLKEKRELPGLLLPVFVQTLATTPWLDSRHPDAKTWMPLVAAWTRDQLRYLLDQFLADRDRKLLEILQASLERLDTKLLIKDADYQSLRAQLALYLRDAPKAAQRLQYIAEQESFAYDKRKAAALSMQSIFREQVQPVSSGQSPAAPSLEVQKGFETSCRLVRGLVYRDAQARRECDIVEKRLAERTGDRTKVERSLWILAQTNPTGYEGQAAARQLMRQASESGADGLAIVEKLLSIPEFQAASFGDSLRELRRNLLFQRISHAETSLEKAERYTIFARQEADHELGQRALREAAMQFENLGDIDRAFYTYESQLQERPGGSEAIALKKELVRLAVRVLRFEKARQYLTDLVRTDPAAEESQEYRREICRLDIGMVQKTATTSCQGEAFANPRGKELQLRLAKALIRRGSPGEAAAWIRGVYTKRKDLSPDEAIHAWALLIEAARDLPVIANEARERLIELYSEHNTKLNAASRRLVAREAYASLKRSLDQFRAFHLAAASSDEYITAVQNFKQSFDELENLYRRVLQTEDAVWGSRALFELSLASQHFAEQLSAPPSLEGLNLKRLENELRTQVSGLRSLSKSQATAAEKTLRKFRVMGESNREIINHNRQLRGVDVLFQDYIPAPAFIPVPLKSSDLLLGEL